VSFASAATIVVVPAAVAIFSPATIRVSASSILTTWAAPAFIIGFAFSSLHICAAFGVRHRPAGGGYNEKREYKSLKHIQYLMKWTFASNGSRDSRQRTAAATVPMTWKRL
jgi:hypothetical protein